MPCGPSRLSIRCTCPLPSLSSLTFLCFPTHFYFVSALCCLFCHCVVHYTVPPHQSVSTPVSLLRIRYYASDHIRNNRCNGVLPGVAMPVPGCASFPRCTPIPNTRAQPPSRSPRVPLRSPPPPSAFAPQTSLPKRSCPMRVRARHRPPGLAITHRMHGASSRC